MAGGAGGGGIPSTSTTTTISIGIRTSAPETVTTAETEPPNSPREAEAVLVVWAGSAVLAGGVASVGVGVVGGWGGAVEVGGVVESGVVVVLASLGPVVV